MKNFLEVCALVLDWCVEKRKKARDEKHFFCQSQKVSSLSVCCSVCEKCYISLDFFYNFLHDFLSKHPCIIILFSFMLKIHLFSRHTPVYFKIQSQY